MSTSPAPRMQAIAPEPTYTGGPPGSVVTAEFPSGARIPVTSTRARVYPGLPSTAPCTLPFYEALSQLASSGPLLDAGAGGGAGARALTRLGREVIAIDVDREALAFAREYAADAQFIEACLCSSAPVSGMAGAIVADTLGHALDPEAFLKHVRACLAPSGTLLIAEPAAHVAQRLLAPARRAYTAHELDAALTRAGFTVEGWLCKSGTFVACVARRVEEPALLAFEQAGQLASRGDYAGARNALAGQRSLHHAMSLELLLGQAELALCERSGDVAAHAFFQAREIAPKDARALSGLARIALSMGAHDDAFRLAAEAADLEPASAMTVATLAMAGDCLEHPDTFNAWRMAVNLAPDDVGIVVGFGRAAALRGEYHFAICAFDRARAYGDQLGVAFHVTLGWLLLADGRRHDAAIEARHAEAIAPGDSSARELFEAAGGQARP